MVQVCQRWGDHSWVRITIIVQVEQQLAEQNGGLKTGFDNYHWPAGSILGIQYRDLKWAKEREEYLDANGSWGPPEFTQSNSNPAEWLPIASKSIKAWDARWHHHRRSAQNQGEEIHGRSKESPAHSAQTLGWIERRWNINIHWDSKAQGEISWREGWVSRSRFWI